MSRRGTFATSACAVAGLLAIAGCGTSFDRERQRVLYEVQQGQYPTAKARVNDLYDCHQAGEPRKPGKSAESSASLPDKHLLLWRMERGLIANLAGDLAEADVLLDQAADLVDVRRTESLAAETGTFLLNDTLRAYAGRGYEHIQVDYYRILNQLLEAQKDLGLTGASASAAPPSADSANSHYEHAMVRARRMTLEQLKETEDAAASHRYHDDPFARFLAGAVCWALPPGERRDTDQQFAQVMFKRSLEAYEAEATALAHDEHFHYEVTRRPQLVERLFLRHALSYDPQDFEHQAERYHLSADRHAALAPGHGMLLVLDHVGYVVRPQVLSIGFGTFAPPLNDSDRRQGATSSTFRIGALGFWAKGPGSDVVGAWVVPLPDEIMRHMTPGGMAVMGLEMPVHEHEHTHSSPARVVITSITPTDAMVPADAELEVVSDLDAYARATLKDEQPRLLAKTITRAVGKQIAVAQGAIQAKKASGGGAQGNLVGLAVNLLGSAAATFSEQADTRAWTTLPDHIEAALVDVPVGTYSLSLDTRYGTVPLGQVTIPAGQLVVVPARTFPERVPEPHD
ncbi:MAG: hypothetical protein H0W83_10900 [Planctomycetes bacterium]|nr:hypothetical protein [Planctomycetota bacterium]